MMDLTAKTPRRRGLKKKNSFTPRLRASAVRLPDASGFTYVLVLAALLIIGILAEAASTVSSRLVRVEREAELLFRGQAYQRAIRSYYEAGNPIKQYPRNLEDLLTDPRFPKRHHLRALYRDPMAQDDVGQWLLVRAADGGIAGVASSSKEEPLKKANFPKGLEKFTAAKTHSDWIFEADAPVLADSRQTQK